jgi:hypothetical protein
MDRLSQVRVHILWDNCHDLIWGLEAAEPGSKSNDASKSNMLEVLQVISLSFTRPHNPIKANHKLIGSINDPLRSQDPC